MTKEQALEDFFSSLKIAFNISALYKKEHPSFIKAAKEFQSKVEAVFDFFNPIKIGVTPNSLMIGTEYFSGAARYEDLARMFHYRRIMSIEIKKGISLEELAIFLSKSSSAQKEIFKEGGLASILGRKNVRYISVLELDYSQLLEGEGGECEDVWAYLLKDAVANNDGRKIRELADGFDNPAKNLKAGELLKNEELRMNIEKFLDYLKINDNSKFSKCLKEMVKSIIRDKKLIVEKNIEKLKFFIDGLNDSEFSSVLSDEILYNENFDFLSFNLFCRLVEKRDYEKIAILTEESLQNKNIKDAGKMSKKIGNLFSLPDNPIISEVYRSALNSFINGLTFERNMALDRSVMAVDYRFILLNLLSMEDTAGQIKLILERLSQVWEGIIHDKDLEYLKLLVEILNKKRIGSAADTIFPEVDKLISDFIEDIIWNQDIQPEMDYFIDNLQSSPQGVDFYINRVFNENKMNYNILKFFLKFFPGSLPVFYGHLEKKYSDMDFIKSIIDAAAKIDSRASIEILKRIYGFSNSFIKVEVLKAMKLLSLQDNDFLFSILRKGDLFARREALGILIRDIKAKNGIFEGLFLMPSPWGAKNNILLENIMMAEEISLIEAKDYLERLSKRRFFWNSNVRAKAVELLRKWHDKKN